MHGTIRRVWSKRDGEMHELTRRLLTDMLHIEHDTGDKVDEADDVFIRDDVNSDGQCYGFTVIIERPTLISYDEVDLRGVDTTMLGWLLYAGREDDVVFNFDTKLFVEIIEPGNCVPTATHEIDKLTYLTDKNICDLVARGVAAKDSWVPGSVVISWRLGDRGYWTTIELEN